MLGARNKSSSWVLCLTKGFRSTVRPVCKHELTIVSFDWPDNPIQYLYRRPFSVFEDLPPKKVARCYTTFNSFFFFAFEISGVWRQTILVSLFLTVNLQWTNSSSRKLQTVIEIVSRKCWDIARTTEYKDYPSNRLLHYIRLFDFCPLCPPVAREYKTKTYKPEGVIFVPIAGTLMHRTSISGISIESFTLGYFYRRPK